MKRTKLSYVVCFFTTTTLAACEVEMDPCDAPDAGNFDLDHLLEVDFTISPEDWDTVRQHRRSFVTEFLGDCMSGPFESEYPTRPAQVTIDGEFLAAVGIRKKGFIGSQSDTKPSLKVNLDEYLEDAELFCTDNVTFNNGVQGPSVIRQCLAYELFNDAGLVAPRCNFADLSVNGYELGIYAHVEPIKKLFLRRRFGNDVGDHYEGTLSDFTDAFYQMFDPKTDETNRDFTEILALQELLEFGTDEQIVAELGDHVHLKDFYRFWAMEIMTGHWDGYNGNRNNFHIYRDTDSGKFTFIAWGLDDTFDSELLGEEAIYAKSKLAQRILKIPELRLEFETEFYDVLDTVWNETVINDKLRSMGDLLHNKMDAELFQTEIDDARTFIDARRDHVLGILSVDVPEDTEPPYCLQESGSLSAEFETTWGSNTTEDVLGNGTLEITMDWDGEVTFYNTGVIAGPSSESPENDELIAGGVIDPNYGAVIIPYVAYPSDLSYSGSRVEIDGSRTFGRIFYRDNSGYFAEAAVLYGGSLVWETNGGQIGDTVSGSLNTYIYNWTPIE